MADKKNKKGEYTKGKNKEEKPKVIETKRIEGEFPPSTQIIKVEQMDKPLATVDEAKAMWAQYQGLMNALIESKDIVRIQDKNHAKKTAINKIARFFGYSAEIVRAYKEDWIGPRGGKNFTWKVWVKAIAPNGRFRVAGAACSSTERRFAHIHHDVYATAETRAKKRAIEELAGMGELELVENGEEKESTITKETKKPGIKEVGVDPDRWEPIRKPNKFSKGIPANPNMEASKAQKDWITTALQKLNLDPETAIFLLDNRADKIVRRKKLEELEKGDAYDLIQAVKKGKEKFLELIEEVLEVMSPKDV